MFQYLSEPSATVGLVQPSDREPRGQGGCRFQGPHPSPPAKSRAGSQCEAGANVVNLFVFVADAALV
jgi:hypothetical protein